MKTKTKKLLSIAALSSFAIVSATNVLAVKNIGDITVTGDATLNTDITWDETFPVNANGSVTGIKVKARIEPTLKMSIDSNEIDLGVLTPGTAASGQIGLEVGTNAKAGVLVTAKSETTGLTKTDDATVKINSDTTDGVAESYTFASTAGTVDSASPAFSASVLAATEVNSAADTHTLYTTNKAEAYDTAATDFNFVVAATADSQTPAGDYEDTITFTITGNF